MHEDRRQSQTLLGWIICVYAPKTENQLTYSAVRKRSPIRPDLYSPSVGALRWNFHDYMRSSRKGGWAASPYPTISGQRRPGVIVSGWDGEPPWKGRTIVFASVRKRKLMNCLVIKLELWLLKLATKHKCQTSLIPAFQMRRFSAV